jgi:hypothetical protein
MVANVIELSCMRFNRIWSKPNCYKQVCDRLDKASDDQKVELSTPKVRFIRNALMKVLFRRFKSGRVLCGRLVKASVSDPKHDQQAVLDKLNDRNCETVCLSFLTKVREKEDSDLDQHAQMAFQIAMNILRYYLQHEKDIYAEAWSAIHAERNLMRKGHSTLREH